MDNLKLYENFQQELNEAKVAKGLMHQYWAYLIVKRSRPNIKAGKIWQETY